MPGLRIPGLQVRVRAYEPIGARGGVPSRELHEKKRRATEKPQVARSVADAQVLKDQNLFFLTDWDGEVPMETGHAFGLYWRDCRFLDGYALRLNGKPPQVLASNAEKGYEAVFELTNPPMKLPNGVALDKEKIGVTWERLLEGSAHTLHDVLSIRNFDQQTIWLPLTLLFRGRFEDTMAVRGSVPMRPGKVGGPRWIDHVLRLDYRGRDEVCRKLAIAFSPAPSLEDGYQAHFALCLEPRETWRLEVRIMLLETQDPQEEITIAGKPDLPTIRRSHEQQLKAWFDRHTEVETDDPVFNGTLRRSLHDLHMLRSHLAGDEFLAGGIPWYVTLFGRDCLLTANDMLAFDTKVAEHLLRLIAGFQGQRDDAWKDEEPGKIAHELRLGELARLGEIPQVPYYGTVDATPLFLVLLAEHARWTGTLDLFHELEPHVEDALAWMRRFNRDGVGFLTYSCTADQGYINQGWKDSKDAIVNADGSLATPPIALAEVQGYAYRALHGLADLYRRDGREQGALELERWAEALRARFEAEFWQPELGCYALALQEDGRAAAVVSSNAGQVLWGGIASPAHAQEVASRLMCDDMFSGWGVRTLSAKEKRYNPVAYHLGTVWPHDNAIIAGGFRKYAGDDAAMRILDGLLEAARHFEHYRLPEVFAGFPRDFGEPVRYPQACHPQAWASGAVPSLVQTMLGLRADAFARRLHVVRPMLPPRVNRMEVRQLRVGDAKVHLRFVREGDGVHAEAAGIEGELDVVVDYDTGKDASSAYGTG